MVNTPASNTMVDEMDDRVLFVRIVTPLVGMIMILFGGINFVRGTSLHVGVVDSLVGILLLGLALFGRAMSIQKRAYGLVILSSIFLTFLLLDGGTGKVGYLWVLMFPQLVLNTLGIYRSRWWLLGGVTVVLVVLLTNVFGFLIVPYSPLVRMQLGTSFITLGVLAFLGEYEKQRKHTELRLLKRHMDLIVDYAPLMLFRVHLDGVVTLFQGRSAKRLFGGASVEGKLVEEVFKEFPGVMTAVRKAMMGVSTYHRLKKDETEFVMFYSPLLGDKKEIVGVVGVGIDQSEELLSRKELSTRLAELAKLNQLMIGRELKMIALKEKLNAVEGLKNV